MGQRVCRLADFNEGQRARGCVGHRNDPWVTENRKIAVPPVPEQAALAAYLDELVGKVEAAVKRLQEYCTALLTATVTGEIDVRRKANTISP